MPREWTDLSERDVVKQCEDLLLWHGWKLITQTTGLLARPDNPTARIRVGEVGTSDKIAIKPINKAALDGRSYVFFLELKRPGGMCLPEQLEWAQRMQQDGHLCVMVDSLEQLEKFIQRFP